MSGGPAPAQLDLENELSCSICTDILYQPLTLLDCLHTFCGACLKEWFLSQASRATSLHPYTCPACRASVRATKHNASIATLLDMYLQINPSKGRTDDEKHESHKIYKAGDNVLPKLRRRGRRSDEEDDQRVLGDVVALSLQDVGLGSSHQADASTSRRRRDDASRERRTSGPAAVAAPVPSLEPRQAGMYLHSREEPRARPRAAAQPVANPAAVPNPSRSLDHQSSLRSLLSVSESDVEEEILRQIMEDGLLNGVDLGNMTTAQEDELTERIAAAYRQRREEQRRARRAAERSTRDSAARSRDHSRHASRTRQGQDRASRSAVHPVAPTLPASTSSPSNLQAPNGSRSPRTNRRHRSASADNSAALGIPRPTAGPAARSASNLPLQPADRRSQSSSRSTHRRSTEPGRSNGTRQSMRPDDAITSTPGAETLTTQEPDPAISPRLHANTFPIDHSRPRSAHSAISAASGLSELPANEVPIKSSTASTGAPQQMSSNDPRVPSVTCRRCNTARIETELHYACFKCDAAGYSICLRCYRQNHGCLHWFGFGWAAWQKYDAAVQSAGMQQSVAPPHKLEARRYLVGSNAESLPADRTHQHVSNHLQSGVFCDVCQDLANDWYWHCDVCNEGEWGYCSSCVNQGRHCTHPLLPLSYQPSNASTQVDHHRDGLDSFAPKSSTTACDICTYPIPPSHSRYHCLKCNDGDYDMHLNCYTSLVKSGQISERNGHNGWRRCLQGHRMIILGFEDRNGGQKRIVVRDLVGGDALREDHETPATANSSVATTHDQAPRTPPASERQHPGWRWTDADGTSRFQSPTSNSPSPIAPSASTPPLQFPPDGGVGLRMLAKWGYYPSEPDELMFPKGAEIKEAEDINGDWHWGVYAGSKGLFPGNYGRVIGRR